MTVLQRKYSENSVVKDLLQEEDIEKEEEKQEEKLPKKTGNVLKMKLT